MEGKAKAPSPLPLSRGRERGWSRSRSAGPKPKPKPKPKARSQKPEAEAEAQGQGQKPEARSQKPKAWKCQSPVALGKRDGAFEHAAGRDGPSGTGCADRWASRRGGAGDCRAGFGAAAGALPLLRMQRRTSLSGGSRGATAGSGLTAPSPPSPAVRCRRAWTWLQPAHWRCRTAPCARGTRCCR